LKDAFAAGQEFLCTPDQQTAGLEIAIGNMKKAMAFIDEFTGVFQFFAERDDRHRCFRRGHDPAPTRARPRISMHGLRDCSQEFFNPPDFSTGIDLALLPR
jgi:hypothetical protein